MKKITKIIGILSAFILSSSTVLSANAAVVDTDKNGATNSAGVIALPFEGELSTLDIDEKKLPSSYNSRDLGYVTPVRNQENTQDCWAFSGLACMETILAKNDYIPNNSTSWFSVSHADGWGTKRSDGTGWQRQYEGGGYPYITLGYLSSWSGATAETNFPFRSPFSQFDINKKYDMNFGATGFIYLDGNDKDTIKDCIMNYGSVSTSYSSYGKFSTNNTTYYYCPAKQSSVNGHSICVVGWDDNISRENFKTTTNGVENIPTNDGAWLCKNSWGLSSGDSGYFWISYEDYYMFGTNFGPTYCIAGTMERHSFNNIYQAETFGATYEFQYLDQKGYDNNVYINVFDFDKKKEFLDKIIFETESVGADYTLYYIPFDEESNAPTSDTKKWTELGNDVVPYSGYISVDMNRWEIPKGKAGIGVRIDTSKVYSDVDNGVGVDEWLTDSSGNLLFKPDSKNGTSYIYYNNKMQDVMDYYRTSLDDDLGGNLVIKAITTEAYLTMPGDANSDDVVNITDALTIQQYICHMNTLSPTGYANADFNGNGIIDVKDTTALQKYIAGIETTD